MSKRFIGLDIATDTVHIAIADGDKKQATLRRVTSHPLSAPEELPKLLADVLGPVAGFGDRLIIGLPARFCYLRWLDFPFRDAKKLASAIELELSVQLPIDMEHFQLAHRSLHDPEQTGRIVAAAVPNELLDAALANFDETSWPAHLVELTPFALATGLSGSRDGDLLVLADEHETVVAKLHQQTPVNLAILPTVSDQSAAEVSSFVVRQTRMLLGANDPNGVRTWLIAPRHAESLQQGLQNLGVQVAVPTLPGQPATAALPGLKAALLALCAAHQDKHAGFNLRQGKYALRGEWQKLRRSFVAVAILASLLIGSLGATAWLKYADLQGRADQLNRQMEQVFRSNFSSRDPIVDIPRQIEVKLNEMRRKTELLGLSSEASALGLLTELSGRLPSDLPIEIKELNYSADNLRLSGFTNSFDAVNQAADRLKASPLFSDAKIADAKMSLDGSRVDFQLQLSYSSRRAQ